MLPQTLGMRKQALGTSVFNGYGHPDRGNLSNANGFATETTLAAWFSLLHF